MLWRSALNVASAYMKRGLLKANSGLRRSGGLKPSLNLSSASAGLKGGKLKSEGVFAMEYREWREVIARPYLTANFPRVCAFGCGEAKWLDIGHIQARSIHPELRMDLDNVQWECVPHNRFGACN